MCLARETVSGSDGKLYALKVVDKTKLKLIDPDFQSVKNETLILSHFNLNQESCPYIVKLHHAFEDDRNACLALEYCPGGELFSIINKHGKLTSRLVKFYGACVLLGLEFLHSKNVIFKDLKAENIVISEDGLAKITDFGLS